MTFGPFRLQTPDASRLRFDTLPFSLPGFPRRLPVHDNFGGLGFTIG
jgi:hypothetical protein